MGNVQFLNDLNPFDTTNTETISPNGSESFDFNTDSPRSSIDSTSSEFQIRKIACEYCQEYFSVPFHAEHVRICSCNPQNLRGNSELRAQTNASTTQLKPNLELRKIACEFCNEPCYLKYQQSHQRICPKNPENVKINCRYCRKTLNLVIYQNHLQNCEESHHQRRRSVDPDSRSDRNERHPLSNLRKIKTNTDIQMGCCRGGHRNGIEKGQESDCPICLDPITSTFDMTVLVCNHKFHRHCLNNWSTRQKRCPICRKGFI